MCQAFLKRKKCLNNKKIEDKAQQILLKNNLLNINNRYRNIKNKIQIENWKMMMKTMMKIKMKFKVKMIMKVVMRSNNNREELYNNKIVRNMIQLKCKMKEFPLQ